ncbi:glycosyltransferase family 2 protein [Ruegeria arenilitoris]|uniref:glycosyltransferase family 2 protein n=1 Tax=Ruegeria arenilitoris TaxID=1173585 RepID=UPI00148096D7|nr:glycosyltransferase family 2 protein [Ruegeria arenilitoris]
MVNTPLPVENATTPGTLLFSAQKDEGPFLLEWIAYHRAIGFENILIFSNNCTDGSDDLLDTVAAAGAITHIRTNPRPDESAQGHAATLTQAHPLYQAATWVCWIDSDEFLNIHAGAGHVSDLISAIGDGHGAMLSWRLFGDSFLSSWRPERLTTEDFTRAAPAGAPPNQPVKCFFRTGDWIERLYIHRPVFTPEAAGLRFIDNDGATVPEAMIHGKRNNGMPVKDNPNRKRQNALAQVNHYAVRTYDVFQLKRIRGSGMKPIGASAALRGRRHGQHFWDKRNTNKKEDTSIHRHLPALRTELDALMAVPSIAAAHQTCCARMTERIQQVMVGL